MRIDSPAPSDIAALQRLWQEAFGDGQEFLDIFFSSGFSHNRCRCVYDGEELIAALYWFDAACKGQKMAYLYAIATAAERRGQGICRILMDNTHAHLAAGGYAAALLVPAEPSLFDYYARMGYTPCCATRTLTCLAESDELSLVRVSAEEYAARRRLLLPSGAVLQEGESLSFLERQATLYASDGLLLAARVEEDELYGLELLGDTASAPAAVHALGCRTGRFRTVGTDESPMAMYLPLAQDAPPAPCYLGFPFD